MNKFNKLIKRIEDWKEHSDTGLPCQVFVDIDDTLLLWNETRDDYDVNHELIDLLFKKYKSGDVEITLWSARGKEYCEKVAKALDITDMVSNYLGKPAIVIDDIEVDALFMFHSFPQGE